MVTKDERLQSRAEKNRAKAMELLRQAQADEKSLARRKRDADTHRKVLEGVTALYGCQHDDDFRRKHEQFRDKALTLNKDRIVFGLPLLPEETGGKVTPKMRQEAEIDAATTHADGSPLHIIEKESEAA